MRIVSCSVFLLLLFAVPKAICQQEILEMTREQTEESLIHLERAEKLIKEKQYQRALLEYNYILQFYPMSIYAPEAQQKVMELTPRTRHKQAESHNQFVGDAHPTVIFVTSRVFMTQCT